MTTAVTTAWFDDMEAMIPHGGTRTRFAPSPTGYMHVGGLRTALYAYLIAKKPGGTFILRIEDTDTARFVEGATEIIIETLKGAGLRYDEGPDIGGPAGPYTQSERKHLYRPYAELLCEKGAAYYCFCDKAKEEQQEIRDSEYGIQNEGAGDTFGASSAADNSPHVNYHYQITEDPCRSLPYEDSKRRADAGDTFTIRMKTPREGSTTVVDMVFGEITAQNMTLDDMIMLKSDGMPTYNFANVVDDHLMGITHVMRGSEYISSAPKYNLLYEAFGWDIPAYITVPNIMRDSHHKLSKRSGDPTYDDLLDLGYLPEAVLNYIALLGWSPGGEREFYTLPELLEVFDVSGISKSPAIFDIEKLNYFNGEYIRALPAGEFSEKARPFILRTIKNKSLPIGAIAAILQARCDKLGDIPEKIGFLDRLPEYSPELYIHKKSKTDEAVSLNMLRAAHTALESLPDWENETIHSAFIALAEKQGVKNATLMWPVRIAISGQAVTPGGAVEICGILGCDESLRRIAEGIEKLGG